MHFYLLDKESLMDFFANEYVKFFKASEAEFFLGDRDEFLYSYLDMLANVMSLAGDKKYNALADVSMLNHRLDALSREKMKKINAYDSARHFYFEIVNEKLFA